MREKKTERALTLTDANTMSGVMAVALGENATLSSHRSIPYAEMYRARTGLLQTPVEHLQEAARDEERRKSAPQ